MPLLATFGLEITTSRRRCTRYTNSCCCSSCMTTPLLPGTRAVQSRECSLPCATFFLKNLKESSDAGCPRHHAQTAQLHDVHLQDDVQAHAPPSSDRSSRISITSSWIDILAIFHLPKILATRMLCGSPPDHTTGRRAGAGCRARASPVGQFSAILKNLNDLDSVSHNCFTSSLPSIAIIAAHAQRAYASLPMRLRHSAPREQFHFYRWRLRTGHRRFQDFERAPTSCQR